MPFIQSMNQRKNSAHPARPASRFVYLTSLTRDLQMKCGLQVACLKQLHAMPLFVDVLAYLAKNFALQHVLVMNTVD